MHIRLIFGSRAAIPAIHWTRYFKIERANCLEIFLLQSSLIQPPNSWQRTYAGDWGFFPLVTLIFDSGHWRPGALGQDPTNGSQSRPRSKVAMQHTACSAADCQF